jgi:hypothetical protein
MAIWPVFSIDPLCCCFVPFAPRSLTMSQSLRHHGIREVNKQLRLRMKNSGLDTIVVQVTAEPAN